VSPHFFHFPELERLQTGQTPITHAMGKPKRNALAAAVEQSVTPPDELTDSQSIARVVKAEGNHIYTCTLPNTKTILVELEPQFRDTVWIRRGGYVLIDLASMDERPPSSRVVGEIVNVVGDEKLWRKQPYWFVNPALFESLDADLVRPKQFSRTAQGDSDDEESNVGKMPPSDSEDEGS